MVCLLHAVQPTACELRTVCRFIFTDAFELANKEFGKLDLVVNNAGTASLNADWQRTIDINLVNTHLTFCQNDKQFDCQLRR